MSDKIPWLYTHAQEFRDIMMKLPENDLRFLRGIIFEADREHSWEHADEEERKRDIIKAIWNRCGELRTNNWHLKRLREALDTLKDGARGAGLL